MAHNKKLNQLFEKYLNNRCSADEIKKLVDYFNTVDNESQLRNLIKNELVQEDKGDLLESQVDAALDEVKVTIVNKLSKQEHGNDTQNPFAWLRVMSIAIVLIASGIFTFRSWPAIRNYYDRVKIMAAITAKGERKVITLADSTKVWLAPLGALKYPNQFRGDLREVHLEGEAFFEVAKDKKHPFIIHSKQIDTWVVGTSFMIRTFESSDQADVTVVTGIVKVSSRNLKKTVTIRPDQQAIFFKTTNSLVSLDYPEAAKLLKRKDGILIYHDISVRQVISDLTRYYNIPIIVDAKSAKCICSGEFDTQKSLQISLDQLVAAIGAKMSFQSGTYKIKGGCEW